MQRHNSFSGKTEHYFGARALALIFILCLGTKVPAATVAFGSFPNNSTHSNASVRAAIANVPTNAGVVFDPIGQTNYLQVYNFGALSYTGPVNVALTLQRIRLGYWMPTETDDGGFFNFNNAGELPNIPRKGNNYYMEFVVWPFINTTNATYDTTSKAYGTVAYPGPMRLLIGLGGEVWFTGDHYGEDGLQINAQNVNPPPPADIFKMTSFALQKTNVLITWNTIGGETNVVQAATGFSAIASNKFVDISPNIVAGGGDLTNASYLDVGGATNFPARVYRVRLVQ